VLKVAFAIDGGIGYLRLPINLQYIEYYKQFNVLQYAILNIIYTNFYL